MPVGVIACLEQCLAEVLGCVVACHGALVGARTVVPPDAHVRIVGYGECAVEAIPLLHRFLCDIFVVIVHPQIVGKLVMRAAVEAQLRDKLVGRNLCLVAVQAAVVEVGAPHGEHQIEVGEAGLLHFLPEPSQCVLCLSHAAQSLDEVVHVVDHEYGLAVNLVVLGELEVHVDVAAAYPFKLIPIYLALPYDVVLLDARQAGVPKVEHIMVGPH